MVLVGLVTHGCMGRGDFLDEYVVDVPLCNGQVDSITSGVRRTGSWKSSTYITYLDVFMLPSWLIL